MNRRPWPLVFLAFFQLFAPFVSVGLSARVNDVGYFEMFGLIWSQSPPLQLLQFFVLPVVMGVLIFYARKAGYLLLIAMILFNVYSNMSEWIAAGDYSNIGLMIAVNLSVLLLLVYLFLPQTREVFFNKNVRWWEADPRFLMSVPARLESESHAGEGVLLDISRGGACVEGAPGLFPPAEKFRLKFAHSDREHAIDCHVVYERGADSADRSKYGLKWTGSDPAGEDDIAALCKHLKKIKHPRSRVQTPWKEDLKDWLGRARRNPKAWAPEIKKPGGPSKPSS